MNLLTQYNSPNYTPNGSVTAVYGMPRSIDYITIHWWGDPALNPSFEGVVSWLCNSAAQVSAHDVITGTGRRVAVLVDYPNAAWHAGNATGNARSLGFECDPRARQEDYETVAEDIAETWKYYGRVIPLRGHNSWIATRCPGVYDLNRLHNMAMAIYSPAPVPAPQPAPTPTPVPVQPEWIRNLNDITDTKLTVLPAEGVRVINLETMQPVNATIIPRGTNVDIAKETTVGGVKYYISSYSANRNVANGMLASSLGVPATPPVVEKPEWLNKLEDIKDVTMYTRSQAPVKKLADGTVIRTLPVNTPVEISMATEMVGHKLLVIKGTETDNGHEAIETVYLSDTPIFDPYADLEKRVDNLEDILKKIVEFFANLMKK